MKCSECGSRVSRRAKYCSKCGSQNALVNEPVEESIGFKAYAKDVAAEGEVALAEVKDAAIKGLKSETGKSMLIWGAFGAVAGAALPFVGAAVVGALGAGYGALKKL